MKFLVLIIFIYNADSLRTYRRQDNSPYGQSTDNRIMGMAPNDIPRLNSYKDQIIQEYDPASRYFYFPDDFGIVHLIDTKEDTDIPGLGSSWKGHEYKYYLFTRANRHVGHILEYGNELRLVESNFNLDRKVVFLAHGWGGNRSSPMNIELTRAFLDDENVNLIVFDWGELAAGHYPVAKVRTREAGRTLGRFVKWLATIGYTMYSKVHLVGHSLGAHVVGNAGRETGGIVARITGMDPAGPLWYLDRHRLTSTDGLYVEVIHTNSLFYGYQLPCGDADFYPNGGESMPGCHLDFSCSHNIVWLYMSNSLTNNHFEAKKCKDYGEMKRDACNGSINLMGNGDLFKDGRGIFRLNTTDKFPFI